MRTGRICVLALLSLASLTGCTTQRPLPSVKESAKYNFDKEHYDAALTDFSEYVDRRPDDLEMRVGLARTYLKLDRAKEARIHAIVAMDNRPSEAAYADLLAESLFAANDRDALVTFLQKRVSERGNVADYIRLGKYQQAMGNLDEAKVALLTACRIDAGHSIAPQLAMADMFNKIGDKTNEILRLKMALYVEPSNQIIIKRIASLGGDTDVTAAVRPDEQP